MILNNKPTLPHSDLDLSNLIKVATNPNLNITIHLSALEQMSEIMKMKIPGSMDPVIQLVLSFLKSSTHPAILNHCIEILCVYFYLY